MVKITAPQLILIVVWGIIISFVCEVGSDVFDHAPESLCDYCAISNHTANVRIIDTQNHLIAFKEKDSSCAKHFIIIPEQHIKNVHSENATCELLTQMQKFCLKLLDEYGYSKGRKILFNNPPFYTIKHLHLHCMDCDANDSSFLSTNFYYNWFATVSAPDISSKCGVLDK